MYVLPFYGSVNLFVELFLRVLSVVVVEQHLFKNVEQEVVWDSKSQNSYFCVFQFILLFL